MLVYKLRLNFIFMLQPLNYLGIAPASCWAISTLFLLRHQAMEA